MGGYRVEIFRNTTARKTRHTEGEKIEQHNVNSPPIASLFLIQNIYLDEDNVYKIIS